MLEKENKKEMQPLKTVPADKLLLKYHAQLLLFMYALHFNSLFKV